MSEFVPDNAALVAAVGVFWYWFALNISSWRQGRTVVMFRWLPLRLGGDALLIALALLWCGGFVDKGPDLVRTAAFTNADCFGPLAWWARPTLLVVALVHLPVPFVMTYLFGRDFLHAVLRKKPL
jgi:hypothetical protein